MPYAKKLAKQYKVGINKVMRTWPFGRTTAAETGIVWIKSAAPVVAEPVDATTAAPVKSVYALLVIHGGLFFHLLCCRLHCRIGSLSAILEVEGACGESTT